MNAPFRILVLDPDVLNVEMLGEVLTDEGFEVFTAQTLEEASAQLEAHDVQLVLADLPGGTPRGPWDSAPALLAAAAPAPVGLISGWRIEEADAIAHGCAFALSKPYQIVDLFLAIGHQLHGLEVGAGQRDVIRRYFEALSRKDWAAFAALCTEDVRYHVPGDDPRFSKTVTGREALAAYAAETFARFPDARFEVLSILGLPTGVVARYASHFADKQLTGSVLFHFTGTLIHEVGVRTAVREL